MSYFKMVASQIKIPWRPWIFLKVMLFYLVIEEILQHKQSGKINMCLILNFPPTLDFFHLKIKEREFQKSYLFLFVYTSPFHIRVDYHRWNRLPAIQNAPYKNFSFYEKLWKPLESFRYFSFHQPWLFCFFVVADPSWIHWISKQTKYKK